MIAIQGSAISYFRTSRAPVWMACAVWFVSLIALSLSASAEEAALSPEGAGALKLESEETLVQPARQEQLDWTGRPGAFEQELRRRVSNPLFSAERQRVRPAELKAAKIRDASDARAVLAEYVGLSLDRRKLARLKTIEEIEQALGRYQTVLRTVMGVGGEVTSLVAALDMSRSALIEQWRVAHTDHYPILAALDIMLAADAKGDPATHNEFAAQLLREDGPILPDELASALLSEPPDTVELVLETLSPKRRSEIQLTALELIQDLASLGVEIEDQQAKVELLLAGG